MKIIIYSLFLSVFLLDYLQGIGVLPRIFTFLPEMLSCLVGGVVCCQLAIRKSFRLSPLYWFIFIFLALNILAGVLLNSVKPEVLFVAIRQYFKYLPFFFLPLVYDFSEKEIKGYLLLLVSLTLIQLPIALYQRFVLSPDFLTGDLVGGTLGAAYRGSGLLTIYLICAITLLTAFRIRKRIAAHTYWLLLAVFVVPTMINETKVTVFLLPLALIIPAIAAENGINRIKSLLRVGLVAVILLGIFIPVYDHFMAPKGRNITDFLINDGEIEGYLLKSEDKISSGAVGRLDAIILPISKLSKNVVSPVFGLGIGNVSHSSLGDEFSGAFYDRYGLYVTHTISTLLWEIGIFGVLLIILFNGLLFKDASKLVNANGLTSDIALGWVGVIFIIVISLFYTNILGSNAISYIYWYFSGYIVAESSRLKLPNMHQAKKTLPTS